MSDCDPLGYVHERRLDNIDYRNMGARDIWFIRDTIVLFTSFEMEINKYFNRPDYKYCYDRIFNRYRDLIYDCILNADIPRNDGLTDDERNTYYEEGYTYIDCDMACFYKDDMLDFISGDYKSYIDIDQLKIYLYGKNAPKISIHYTFSDNTTIEKIRPDNKKVFKVEKIRYGVLTESLRSQRTPPATISQNRLESNANTSSIQFDDGEQKIGENAPESTHKSEEQNPKGNAGSRGLWDPRDEIVARAAQFMEELVNDCNCRCKHDKLANIAYDLGNNGGSFKELDGKNYNLWDQFKAAALKIVPEERHFGTPQYNSESCKCEIEDHKNFKH